MFDSDKDFLEKASDSFKSNLMPDDLVKIAEEPHWRRAIFLLERGNLNETEIAKTLASLANLESISPANNAIDKLNKMSIAFSFNVNKLKYITKF